MDPEDSIEYLRAIKKYNCCIGCMIRHRPPDSNPKYVKISPGSSKTWIKTFCDANGVSLGTDFSKELTLGVEQVMETLFGTCKILVTEGVGGGVKTRYEVLGENMITFRYGPGVGTIITGFQAINQFNSDIIDGHFEVNGCTLPSKFVRVG